MVVNEAPQPVDQAATLFKIRIESAYFVGEANEIQGLRGELLQPAGLLGTGTKIEIRTRLPKLCDTWIEMWSATHDTENGVLSGYVIGRPMGTTDGYIRIWPMLYRTAEYQRGDPDRDGSWHLEHISKRRPLNATERERDFARYHTSDNGIWRAFKVDADALANNLEATNQLIREGLEATAK